MESEAGEAHKKEFRYSCNLGDHQSHGIGTTKKEAKQRAAKQMYELIDSSDSSSLSGCENECENVQWLIPLEELPTVEDILAEYHRLKKQYVSPPNIGIRYRKNFFLKLPLENRMKAEQILIQNHSDGLASARNIVDDVMRTLKLNYNVRPKSSLFVFTLEDSDYDCVIMSQQSDLYYKVIDYLKTMLNVRNIDY